jgi:NTE family protein
MKSAKRLPSNTKERQLMSGATYKTAFVFAGGGSLGAVQVGMLRELLRHGLNADFVVGSSVGALNAAYFAAAPNSTGADKLEGIWCGLRRSDIFPVTLRSLLRFVGGQDHLIDSSNLRALIKRHVPYVNLEGASIPVHVVATNLGGVAVCLSSGPAIERILASAAIPAAFPPVRIDDQYLIDGAIGSNTAILTAARLGAARIIVLPTGFACDLHEPPRGAIARVLHAITLLIANQIVRDLKELAGKVDISIVPSLCPLDISPYDFSNGEQLIERAADSTRKWIDGGGLLRSDIPNSLLPHSH